MAEKKDPVKVAQDAVTAAEKAATRATANAEKAAETFGTATAVAETDGASDTHKKAAETAGTKSAEAATAKDDADTAVLEAGKALDIVVAEAETKLPMYTVAKGRSITAKGRRVLDGDDDDAVKVTDLSGGKKSFDALVKAGYIVKNG